MKIDIFKFDKDLAEVMRNLTQKFGIPTVWKDMAIYFSPKTQSRDEVHFRFRNKKCLMLYVDSKTDELFRPRVHVDMDRTTVRSLLTLFKKIGYENASIGIATCYEYYQSDDVFIELLLDTFIGNFVQIGYGDSKKANKFKKILVDIGLKKVERDRLKSTLKDKKIKLHKIINEMGMMHDSVGQFAKDVGLSSEVSLSSLKLKVANFSNDYSFLEKAFNKLFNHCLLDSHGFNQKFERYVKPVSIIIPCFNSGETFIKTLFSIDKQNLPADYLKKLDVILVDDGSSVPVRKILEERKPRFKFNYRVICLSPNMGLANARNAGVSLAENEIIIFLDSDIVLADNYLLEHCLRNLLIPNAIFVSFKENVNLNDERISSEVINQGLKTPRIYNDSRVRKVLERNTPGLYEVSGRIALEVLSQSSYFKELGNGRTLGVYDLSSMIVGHNMSCRRENILKVNGFSGEFKGWGMEDSYFGAKMIAEGNFVIPVISTGVYHLDHPPRSGSDSRKSHELQDNLKRYDKLINKSY